MKPARLPTIPMLIGTVTLLLGLMGAASAAEHVLHDSGFEPEKAEVYTFDTDASKICVLVYRGGFFSNAGHNHVLAIEDFDGTVSFDMDLAPSGFELSFRLEDMILDRPEDRAAIGGDFSRPLSDKDITNTWRNMLGEKVLDAERYPEVRLESTSISGTLTEFVVITRIHLHGVVLEMDIPVTVEPTAKQIIATGEFELRQKDFGIRPFSAALGTLKVKNEFTVRFRLVARSHINGV